MTENKVLYAPWRDTYVTSSDSDKIKNKKNNCVFCDISQKNNKSDDFENRVLFRDNYCFIVMNKFPYTPGHFMIIPHHHTENLEDLNPETWQIMTNYAQQGVKMLKNILKATGVNLGMNLGKSAGAGIAEHIHLHLVPRFERDTNFITTVANNRVYSTDFDQIFNKLKLASSEYFKK
jgi:diadenosine tetraphosphate (Ap4A) HIT family hydrolase